MTDYISAEFPIPYGSPGGLEAVTKIWELFYSHIEAAEGIEFDRAIWQCSIDDVASVILLPGAEGKEYEMPFLISTYLPDIDNLNSGWDTESLDFDDKFSTLHNEFFSWIRSLISSAWLSDQIQEIHANSRVESLSVYATDEEHLLTNAISKMVWLAGPKLADTTGQRTPRIAIKKRPPS